MNINPRIQFDDFKPKDDVVQAHIHFNQGNVVDVKAKNTFGRMKAIKHWVQNHIKRQYVSLRFGDKKIEANIVDLAKLLAITPKGVIQAAEDNHLEQMLYNQAVQTPLTTEQKEEVDAKVQSSMEQLRKLDKQVLPDEVRKQTEDVLRIAFKILETTPKDKNVDQTAVIPITHEYSMEVHAHGQDLKILGLFGKKLGSGSFGVAIQRVDLMKQQLSTDPEAVMKMAHTIQPGAEEDLQKEVVVLNKLHAKGTVLGIQRPVRQVRISHFGKTSQVHVGPQYTTDLFGALYEGVLSREFTETEKLSLCYQTFHGLACMHDQGVTNGDIKSENAFIEVPPQTGGEDDIGPLLFIADFGGAEDHANIDPKDYPRPVQTGRGPVYEGHTPQMRHPMDNHARMEAHKQELELVNNGKPRQLLVQEVEKKADVCAACMIICAIMLKDEPFNIATDTFEPTSLKPHIEGNLKKTCLSDETCALVMRGMSETITERPGAREIMVAVMKDLEKYNPELAAKLKKRSVPVYPPL